MSRGRGSAASTVVIGIALALLCLLIQMERSHAATYTVGGSAGWAFNTDTWPKGKRFRAGDVLSKFICNQLQIYLVTSSVLRPSLNPYPFVSFLSVFPTILKDRLLITMYMLFAVFNYDSTTHNVVAVDRSGYNSCTAPAGAKVYGSGKDQIKLARGQNYFICSSVGHCQSGMRIAINAV